MRSLPHTPKGCALCVASLLVLTIGRPMLRQIGDWLFGKNFTLFRQALMFP